MGLNAKPRLKMSNASLTPQTKQPNTTLQELNAPGRKKGLVAVSTVGSKTPMLKQLAAKAPAKASVDSKQVQLNKQPKPKTNQKLNRNNGKANVKQEHNSQQITGNARGTKSSPYDVQKRLKTKSPWYSSIVDPIKGAGAKIPDANGTETGTLQTVQEIAVLTNANGVSGFKLRTPYPNSLAAAGASGNYYYTGAGSTAANLGWGSVAIGGDPLAVADTLKAYTRGVRIVSGCIIAMPELATLSDSGEMCAFVTPFGSSAATVSYIDLVKNYDSTTVPVNAKLPIKASWYPTSMADTSGYTFDYTTFVPPNDVLAAASVDWEFGVVCTGLTASTGQVKFKIVVNYEYIPLYNVMDIIDSAESPQDGVEEGLVQTWIQELPSTGTVSMKAATSAPAAVTEQVPPDQTFGFGMLFDVIKEIAPIALALI